ncbi:hypothetical protein FGO68_gene11332 [Halteria grandinella]|uniref:Uncharacterized protein n=1 Tax=Halteria grandinella TaxID=5974 RepID=A0A8J8T3M7_HALGN|nr:hypothetical protein FGO68_gene11332 [Halteria grandinella]
MQGQAVSHIHHTISILKTRLVVQPILFGKPLFIKQLNNRIDNFLYCFADQPLKELEVTDQKQSEVMAKVPKKHCVLLVKGVPNDFQIEVFVCQIRKHSTCSSLRRGFVAKPYYGGGFRF